MLEMGQLTSFVAPFSHTNRIKRPEVHFVQLILAITPDTSGLRTLRCCWVRISATLVVRKKLVRLAATITGSIAIPDRVVSKILVLTGVLVTATFIAAIMHNIESGAGIDWCDNIETARPSEAPIKNIGKIKPPRNPEWSVQPTEIIFASASNPNSPAASIMP